MDVRERKSEFPIKNNLKEEKTKMNEAYKKAEEFDKEYKYLKKKWEKWLSLEDFSGSAVNPFFECLGIFDFMILIKAILILLVLGALTVAFVSIFGISFTAALIIAAILYFIPFTVFHIVSKIKVENYWKKLSALKENVKSLQNEYFDKRCKESNIFDGYIYFTNGIAVGGRGSIIEVNLERDCGNMQVFRKSYDFGNYEKEIMNNNFKKGKNKMLLNDSIASLEFNENFCVIAEKGTERNCLTYLSPAMQLNLIQKSDIYSFLKKSSDHSLFTIKNNYLIAETKHVTAPYGYIAYDISGNCCSHSAVELLEAIDQYCEIFPKIAYEVIEEFEEKVSFLGGSVRAQNV